MDIGFRTQGRGRVDRAGWWQAGLAAGILVLCGCSSEGGTPSPDGDADDAETVDDGAPSDDGAPPDDDPPRLYTAVAETGTRVRLVFNEPLADDANNGRHFRIAPELWIENVAFGATPDILLVTTEPQMNGQRYDIEVVREDTSGDTIIDARDNILTDVAGNPIDPDFARAEFIGISQEVHVIVDVMVTDNASSVPAGYTGISWNGCTDPFFEGEVGTRVEGTDVNSGIGGTTTTIWVKYERLPVTSSTPVLTRIAAQHWPYWTASCPDGWSVANGASSGIRGALTTATSGDCWRIGLCVLYEPLNAADAFVSNLSFSWPGADPTCPALCAANDAWWPMIPDGLDIHMGCGDDQWLRICSNRAGITPPMPAAVELTDSEKVDLITTYAPRVWLASSESYWPASVDWAFPYMERYLNSDGNYWIRTRDALSSPSDGTLAVFAGNRNLAEVPVYAFWIEKAIEKGDVDPEVVDVVYFTFYPYNRGKLISVIDTVVGSHVGDWEHVSVRLTWRYNAAGGWRLAPALV